MRHGTAALIALFLASTVARSEIIDNYDPTRHDRFLTGTFANGTPPIPSPSFLIAGADLSGVGWVPNPTPGVGTKHVTMISDIHYVSADHFALGIGTTVAFRANDGSYVTRTVQAQTTVANSDVMIGTLSSAVPTGPGGVSFYPVTTGAQAQFLGQTIFMIGQRGRVGRNVIGGFQTVPQQGSTGPTLVALSDYEPNFTFDAFGFAQPSPPTDEFVVQGGDSGSPSLMMINGQVTIMGHHYVQVQGPGGIPGGTGDAFYANYIAQMQAVVPTLGLTPVPEPAAVLAVALPAAALWLRRRRASDAQ